MSVLGWVGLVVWFVVSAWWWGALLSGDNRWMPHRVQRWRMRRRNRRLWSEDPNALAPWDRVP